MKALTKLTKEKLILDDKIEQFDKAFKELKATRLAVEEQIANYFYENDIQSKVLIGDKEVKGSFKALYTIQGGKKVSPKRTEFLAMAEELGAKGVKTFKEMDEGDMQKFIDGLPFETLQDLIKRKILSVYQKPVIVVKIKKED